MSTPSDLQKSLSAALPWLAFLPACSIGASQSAVIELSPQCETLPIAEPEVVKVKRESAAHVDDIFPNSCSSSCGPPPAAGGALAVLVGRRAEPCRRDEHPSPRPTATLLPEQDDDPYARAYIAYRLDELLTCYERGLADNPALVGVLSLRVAIGAGRVAGKASALDASLDQCIEEVLGEPDLSTIREATQEYRIAFCPAGTVAAL